MKTIKQKALNAYGEPIRRLSIWRLFIALAMIVGISYSSLFSWQWLEETKVTSKHNPWFAAYVDVTSTPTFAFEQLGSSSARNVVLAFIVSSPTDVCTPTWGGVYDLDEAGKRLDLDRRIARLQQQKGQVAVSFGGLLNDELAVKCKDTKKLLKAYMSVIERYKVDTIDLDLENTGLTDTAALKRRAQVIAMLQKQRRAENKNLAVWLTLPVAPKGLTQDGTNAVSQMLASGVDLAGVNVMTMDYGSSKEKVDTMYEASEKALKETHRQLGIIYKQNNINLNANTVWTKIGATPMIGQNDVVEEVFSIEDAEQLNTFAVSKGLGRMSMWSANRDIPCGENYVDVKKVSDSCSGFKAEKRAFSVALSVDFDGNLLQNAGVITKEDPDAAVIIQDDPEKSPYQIWKETGAYLEGTKVVWHGNVYEAKWWTQGDLPDNPVLQSWETSWLLIGPVLPGEKRIDEPTLPKGTYPAWSGTEEYDVGDRVLFNDIPYQAKWWTLGESPAAATSNADSSPWVPLTHAQIKDIVTRSNRRP